MSLAAFENLLFEVQQFRVVLLVTNVIVIGSFLGPTPRTWEKQ
jgi:hypothetical protein